MEIKNLKSNYSELKPQNFISIQKNGNPKLSRNKKQQKFLQKHKHTQGKKRF